MRIRTILPATTALSSVRQSHFQVPSTIGLPSSIIEATLPLCRTRRLSSSSTRHITNRHMSVPTAAATNDDDETSSMIMFGKFRIKPSQVFYRSPNDLSAAIVNLRPIVPGHVLVISRRVVPRLSDLSMPEYIDVWDTVRMVQSMLASHYHHGEGGFNIAVQDGKVAGQTVPHVHVHILPRVGGDYQRNDDIYDELQDWTPTNTMRDEKKGTTSSLLVPEDIERVDRTLREMEEEASMYRRLFLSMNK